MTLVLVLLTPVALLWLWLLVSPAHRATYSDLLNSTTGVAESVEPFPPAVAIIAARNEAATLPRTIPTICGQDYPNLRVILVDDQSEDLSPAVIQKLCAEHQNLTTIRASDRPTGWMGKCWAVQQGVEHFKSQISSEDPPLLLFTDADIAFHPQAVRRAVERMQQRQLDMLSLMPRCVCETPIERLGVGGLMTLLSLMFPIGWANDPRKKWSALACGAFILVRRESYEKIGGHACVRSAMIEDVNLARHLKRSGAALAVHNTRDLVSTRMYENFDDLWEGLTKNAYAGMEYQPRQFWVGLVVGFLVGVFPPIYLLLTLIRAVQFPSASGWAACGLALLINLCMTLIHARTVRHLGLPILYALTFPISAALYNLIAIDSVFQHHFRGGNVWKGRRYQREMLLEKRVEVATCNATAK